MIKPMTLMIKPSQHINIENKITEKEPRHSFNTFDKKNKFAYSIKDTIWELCWLHRWRVTNKSCKRIRLRSKLFKEGIESLHSELDYAWARLNN